MQPDAVRIGQRSHFRRAHRFFVRRLTRQPLSLFADRGQRTAIDLVGTGVEKSLKVAQGFQSQRKIAGCPARKRVAIGQQGCQRGRLLASNRQHMRKARVQGLTGNLLAMRSDPPLAIQSAEHLQKGACLGQGALMGRCQERQVVRLRAPNRQLQRKPREVGGFDFGRWESQQPAFFALGP